MPRRRRLRGETLLRFNLYRITDLVTLDLRPDIIAFFYRASLHKNAILLTFFNMVTITFSFH